MSKITRPAVQKYLRQDIAKNAHRGVAWIHRSNVPRQERLKLGLTLAPNGRPCCLKKEVVPVGCNKLEWRTPVFRQDVAPDVGGRSRINGFPIRRMLDVSDIFVWRLEVRLVEGAKDGWNKNIVLLYSLNMLHRAPVGRIILRYTGHWENISCNVKAS